MDASKQARQLLVETAQFHKSLIDLAREISDFKEILDFLVDCISFAEAHLPPEAFKAWKSGPPLLDELSKRSKSIYAYSTLNPHESVRHIWHTSGSAVTGIYSVLTDNFRHLEDNDARSQFTGLTLRYRGLLSGSLQQEEVYTFLAPLNSTAQSKFDQSLKEMKSLPDDEDPQGPLLAMRSAIDITVESLIKLMPLTRRERGDLQSVDLLPTIAHHLAKDELAKVDLILANEQFGKLKRQLSASKETKLPRAQAEALMHQAVAVLNLIASTIKLPEKSEGA